MFVFGLPGSVRGFDPLFLVLAALALEAVAGGLRFPSAPHPVGIIGSLVAVFDRWLNRESSSEGVRFAFGVVVVLIVVTACGGIGWGVGWLTRAQPFGWGIELVLAALLISQRSLHGHVRAVADALENGGAEEGRKAVAHIVGRDPASLDCHGIARASIESCAENFSDGVVAPVFWYALFGMPGLLAYKAVNTMDSMIGYRTPRYRAFGKAAARLDDLLNLIPARLAGLLISLAALAAPSAHPAEAVRTMLRDASRHRSVNAGWPEGAMAGSLGLALAGPRSYPNAVAEDSWIGGGTPDATAGDIHRALRVYVFACLFNAAWVAALFMLR